MTPTTIASATASSSPRGSPHVVDDNPFRYSPNEEIANSVIHGIGAGLSIAGLSLLVTLAGLFGDVWRVVSFSVYGTTLVVLYLASTFYHSFSSPRAKRVFRTLDHAAIFLLIAGTYTPFALVTLRGVWGWSIFGFVWTLALAGILLSLRVANASKLSTALIYLPMGWLIVVAIKPLVAALPFGGMVWLAVGGLAYTLGVVFYVRRTLPFHHAIWHLFVLAGSISHFFAILFYVLP